MLRKAIISKKRERKNTKDKSLRRSWTRVGIASALMVAMLSTTISPFAFGSSDTSDEQIKPLAVENTEVYLQRFLDLRDDLKDPANGYFSKEGIPYHSIETLLVEAPDYGHVTTSEALSYYMWLEAMYGKFTGDFTGFEEAWNVTETYIIPTEEDQPNTSMSKYNASKPATYAPEGELPSAYPAALNFNAAVGVDPIHNDLVSTYGTSTIYGMHWLLDVDNWYGYGSRGDGVTTPSYINTFQRGEQESSWETIPHPCWDEMTFGGDNGYLDLFVGDNSYSSQFKYTNAPDADGRAVQATYWANEWAKEYGVNIDTYNGKATKMGDYLRYAMFDKYFRKIGDPSQAGTGYDAAHYLMSWYYAWGGGISSDWAWKIGSSHNHFGYQNPMAAWILSNTDEFEPQSTNGASDWAKSLDRQLEFYQWLQSAEGGIAGGASNSNNGRYEAWPAGTSTFYGMGYEANPVYADPGSNTWFGFQAWSVQRVAELYYQTQDVRAKNILDKWVDWVQDVVILNDDGTFAIPNTIEWTGQPDTWTGSYTGNPNLHVNVVNYGTDLGVAGSLANTLLYYSKASGDDSARVLAKEILDRIWNLYRDDKGVAAPETRADYVRFFEQEIYIPSGWTGTMPNGDVMKSGVKFIDIRTKYKDDPQFQKLLDAYNNGTDPEFVYHRFWAQCDVAIANGVYYNLFGEGQEPVTSATISPAAATFDKNTANQELIQVDITSNGNSFQGIKNGSVILIEGYDYVKVNDRVTILPAYLATKSVGELKLTFDMDKGMDPVLTITIVDTTPSGKVTPTTATFDKNPEKQSSITATLDLAGHTLSKVTVGSSTLALDTDYTVNGTTVVIKESYLSTLNQGTHTITFDLSAGIDPVLVLTVTDTSVVAGDFKVQMFNGNTSAQTNGISPRFKIQNNGTEDIQLSEVKLRYYYTIDGEKDQNFWCDWSHVGSSNVTGTFVKMGTATTNADYYLEIGFTSDAGTLAPGQSIEVQGRFSKTDWTNYTQSNDYSFASSGNSYVDWSKTTGYLAGNLKWGIEP